jgi:hypothetical protein
MQAHALRVAISSLRQSCASNTRRPPEATSTMKDYKRPIGNFFVSWGIGFLHLCAAWGLNFRHLSHVSKRRSENAMWRDDPSSGVDIPEPLTERIFYDSSFWFTLLIPLAVLIIISSQIKTWHGMRDHGKAAGNQVRTRSPANLGGLIDFAILWPIVIGVALPHWVLGLGGVSNHYDRPWATVLGAVILLFIALFNEHKVADIQVKAGSSAKPAAYLIVSAIIWHGFIEPWEYALLQQKTRPGNFEVCSPWDRGDTMLMALGSGLVLLIALVPAYVYGTIVFRAIRKRF